jgi:hypothetical protein
MSSSRSKYILCIPWDPKPFELDIFSWQDKPDGYFFNYRGRTYLKFEKRSSLGGLTFYLILNHDRLEELKALLADPEGLTDLHRRSLAWWNEKLSEQAVAQAIARCLEAPSGSTENDWA